MGEMAPWLRVLVAIAEVPGPTWSLATQATPALRGSDPHGHCIRVVYKHTCGQNIHIKT